LAYNAFTLGWTINGKNNTETNFIVGVTKARVYVTEKYMLMDVGSRSWFSINWTYVK